MSDSSWCRTCGEFIFRYKGARPHKCPPCWCVMCPDQGEEPHDASHVYAQTAQEAAEKWAYQDDCGGDYTIIGGSPATVLVWRRFEQEHSEGTWFEVEGEAVPEYTARETEAPK